MRIPKVIRIAGQDYKVKQVRMLAAGELKAQIVHSVATITLATCSEGKRYAEGIMAEALMHEVIHGVNRAWLDTDLSEEQVRSLSRGLFEVFRNNKGLDFHGP